MPFLLRLLQLVSLVFPMLSYAADSSILISDKQNRNPSFLFSRGNYDDIRIVANNSSIWFLKRGPFTVSAKYLDGEIRQIAIKRILGSQVIEAQYDLTLKKNLHLSFYRTRLLEIYNSTDSFDANLSLGDHRSICAIQQDATARFASLSNALQSNALEANIKNILLDSSCPKASVIAGPIDDDTVTDNSPFSKGLADAVTLTKLNGTQKSTFSICLQNPETQKIYKSMPDYENRINLLAAKFNLEAAKIAQGSPDIKAMVKCQKDASPKASAKCLEGGPITFYNVDSTSDPQSENTFEKRFVHELCHKSGEKDELLISSLIKNCVDKVWTDKNLFTIGKGIATFSTATPTPVAVINQAAVDSAPISKEVANNSAIPKEISPAQLQIPTAAQLAQPIMTANSNTSQGLQNAEDQSRAQSTPLFNFANLVTGASQPALAANPTAAKAGDSTSSIAYTTGSSGLKTGERIVQEINVSPRIAEASPSREPATVSTTSPNTVAAPKVLVAPNSGLPSDIAAAAGIRPNNSASGATVAGSSNGNVGASAAAIAAADPGGNSLSQTQPQPIARAANRQPSSIAATTRGPSSEELTTYILNSDYSSARKKLEDPKIQTGLRINNITIIDLGGNHFGATKGAIIILDQGDRFVRQK